MPNRPVRTRRIVVDFLDRVPSTVLVPPEQRAPTRKPLTATEIEMAALVSLTGNLHTAAFCAGVSRGYARGAVARIAHKLYGTLPAMARVIVWARGGTLAHLGVSASRRVPEHLLRPSHRGQDPSAPANQGRMSPRRRKPDRMIDDDRPYSD